MIVSFNSVNLYFASKSEVVITEMKRCARLLQLLSSTNKTLLMINLKSRKCLASLPVTRWFTRKHSVICWRRDFFRFSASSNCAAYQEKLSANCKGVADVDQLYFVRGIMFSNDNLLTRNSVNKGP